ncbi:hypothetical protein JXO52_04380 [bacterium]|nr:hypothetical protein [bacterium]
MTVIMIVYYLITAFTAAMLIWNFIREKSDRQKMVLYLIVLTPLLLRILRIR